MNTTPVIPELTVGADPEVFVRLKHKHISAFGMPFGTKEKPMVLPHGSMQVDGMALEFNVTPAKTERQFVGHVIQAKRDAVKELRRHVKGATVDAIPSVRFGQLYWNSLPDEAKVLGCNPDYCAWTESINPPPDADEMMRTGAGHVHLGWTNVDETDIGHFMDCVGLAKQLDYYLGLNSVIWDRDHTRRKLYGKAGAFRPKPYGVEYRVPSNVWVSDPKLMAVVFRQTKRAFDSYMTGQRLEAEHGAVARRYIDGGITDWPQIEPVLAKKVLA